jgi:hypothetical protein
LPATVTRNLIWPSPAVHGGGLGEHGPAGPVEVAGEHVQHVHQPLGQRAELGRTGADAGVDGRRPGPRELARQSYDHLGRHARAAGDHVGREVLGGLAHLVEPVDRAGDPGQVLGEQRVHEAEQQIGVRAGPDEHVLVGQVRGPGAAGIDHDQPAAPAAQRPEPAREVGGGAEGAVGLQRVGAQHQQEVGAVQVGHRDGERMAEHQPAGHVLGHLVGGAGGEDVAGAQRPDQGRAVQRARHRVRARVAQVDAGRLAAVPLHDLVEPSLDGGERLLPADLPPQVALPDQRPAQAVGVLVQLAEARALGADEALAERVVPVAPHARHVPAVVDGQRQAADGFAQGAGPVDGRGHRHS